MPVATGRKQHVPDILDCLAQLSNDEVPTPPKLARAMLDLLPKEVWSNPDYKWLDPCCKSGAILREVAARLLVGLEKWQPNFDQRREHIFRNMLYGTAVTELTGQVVRRSVYCSRDAAGKHSVVRFEHEAGNLPFVPTKHVFRGGRCRFCGSPEELERGASRENYAYVFIHGAYPTKEMSKMKFDVIVGNPPYQVGTEGFGATASTIYHRFVAQAIDLEPQYVLMITPSRWFTGGKGLEEFRARMINDRHLQAIVDNPKVYDCFPGVKIEGGVSYFLWNRDHDADCEFSTRVNGKILSTTSRDLRDGDGVLVRDNRAISIIRKAETFSGARVADVSSVTKPFGLTMRSNYPGSVPKPFAGSIPLIYADHVGYSRPDQIQRNHDWIGRWKVLLPMAFGDVGGSYSDDSDIAKFTVLGEPIALAPGSACTQTYFIVGMFRTREETENFAYYLATKFVRFLVLQRKTTQHVTPDRFRFVPMLNMKRRWTDIDLYRRFKLTQEERDYIEKSIKPRSVNLSLKSPIPASHLPGGMKYRPGAAIMEEE
jgi:site-specific DNA-methyltransferase (adenine-specific)